MRTAGIVLCGGRSSRMGAPKAWLPFGGEFMLPRVVKVVRDAVGTVVVVAAPGQDVPPLPDGVTLVRDEEEGRGPLAGLAAGLAALEGTADAVYLSSCDVPLLTPEFVQNVVGRLEEPNPPTPFPEGKGEQELRNLDTSRESEEAMRAVTPFPSGKGAGGLGPLAVVPRVNGHLHPLAAAFRVGVLAAVRAMLAENRLRMTDLFDRVPTYFLEARELADTDSLRNINTPEDYEAALRELRGAD